MLMYYETLGMKCCGQNLADFVHST